MSKACLICKAIHLEMVDILRYPGKLDYMLNCLLGLQAQQDDYLCNKCCNDVIKAFDSKQNFHPFSLFEPKVLRRNGVAVKDEDDQFEKTVFDMSEVKIEPKSECLEEDVEDANNTTTDINQCEMLVNRGLESEIKEQQDTDDKHIFAEQQKFHLFSLLEPRVLRRDGEAVKDEDDQFEKTVFDMSEVKIEPKSECLEEDVEDANNTTTDINQCEMLVNRGLESEIKEQQDTDDKHIFAEQQKFHLFSLLEPRVLRRDGEAVKDDVEQSDITVFSAVSEVKMEPKNEAFEEYVEDSNDGTTNMNHYGMLMKPGLESKVREQQDSDVEGMAGGKREKYPASLHETMSFKKDFNITTLDAGCKYTNIREHFKREKSIDIEDSTDEENPNDERDVLSLYKLKVPDSIHTADIKKHERTHTGENPSKCCECETNFISSRRLEVHKRTYIGEKPYNCCKCEKGFITLRNLERHKRTHTGEKPYKCHECEKGFTTLYYLKVHEKIHTGEKPYKCCKCGKAFITGYELKIHERTHTGERPYKCYGCEKGFITLRNLERHERTHTGEKPYKCHECEKCFATLYSLKVHEKIHTGEKPYKCCKCAKAFITGYELKIHERTHTGEKPYKCSECETSFISPRRLKAHQRIHIGEKPYKCFECEKGFVFLYLLKAHESTHTGEKRYKCSKCEKGFITLRNLERHDRTHTGEKPYKCQECEKCFTTLYYLKVHERIHTGEKPYKCYKCEKGFIATSALKSHERTHSEGKPYKCCECEKSFKTPRGLIVHERTHTGENALQVT